MKSDPLDHETAGERWRRRGLTFPAYGLLTLGVSSAFPALALLTLAIDLACRNRTQSAVHRVSRKPTICRGYPA